MSDAPHPQLARWIVLCPGQGAQAVGMGKGWASAAPAARDIFARADRAMGDRLGVALSELCFAGPVERLHKTDASQPAIYATSMACWAGLLAQKHAAMSDAPRMIAAAAGLSLGEYTALAIAGAFTFEDGLELVALRGAAMQDAADAAHTSGGGGGSGMLALIGGTDEQAEEICGQARGNDVLVCANYNAPGQVVLSGHKVACERAAKVAEAMGLRPSMLPVAGAFHSPLMAPAAEQLSAALAKTAIRTPLCPVVANVTAKPYGQTQGDGTPDAIRRRLSEQLTSPVRWAQGCKYLAESVIVQGTGAASIEVHELAPGRTLMGLMRRIEKSVRVVTHEEPGDM